MFERVWSEEGSDEDLQGSLARLASLLRTYHRSQVVILIDEYDKIVTEEHLHGYGQTSSASPTPRTRRRCPQSLWRSSSAATPPRASCERRPAPRSLAKRCRVATPTASKGTLHCCGRLPSTHTSTWRLRGRSGPETCVEACCCNVIRILGAPYTPTGTSRFALSKELFRNNLAGLARDGGCVARTEEGGGRAAFARVDRRGERLLQVGHLPTRCEHPCSVLLGIRVKNQGVDLSHKENGSTSMENVE